MLHRGGGVNIHVREQMHIIITTLYHFFNQLSVRVYVSVW